MRRRIFLKAVNGKWAFLDNSNIFGNIIFLNKEEEMNNYHLVDSNLNEIQIGHVSNYLEYKYY